MCKPLDLSFALLILAAVLSTGCSREDRDGAADDDDQTQSSSPPQQRADPAADVDEGRQPVPAAPDSADAAVLAVARGIAQNRPEALWEFLPPSYRRDVNDTVHEFARRMDAELWDRTFLFLDRVTKLCRKHRDTILSSPALQQADGIDSSALAANWDRALGLVDLLVDSDLSDLQKLKRFDGGRFLANTGGDLMQQLAALDALLHGPRDDADTLPWNRLAGLKATLVSAEGDAAVVRLEFPESDEKVTPPFTKGGPGGVERGEEPAEEHGEDSVPPLTPPYKGGEPAEVAFVRIEGKWVSRSMAAGWKPAVASIRADLRARLAPDVLAANKVQVLAMLDSIDPLLTRLEQAQSPTEFQKALDETKLIEGVLALLPPPAGGDWPRAEVAADGPAGLEAAPGKAGSNGSRTVTVIVEGDVPRETISQFADRLFDLDPRIDVAPPVAGAGPTRISVSPVADPAAFARRIDFAEVTAVDAAKRTITVRLKGD